MTSETTSGKVIFIIIAIGIWAIVLQNAGIISTKKNVYVEGGNLNARVSGNVDVSGNVNVDNTVSVSIDEVLDRDGKNIIIITIKKLWATSFPI